MPAGKGRSRPHSIAVKVFSQGTNIDTDWVSTWTQIVISKGNKQRWQNNDIYQKYSHVNQKKWLGYNHSVTALNVEQLNED